jgi:hypothetical protein
MTEREFHLAFNIKLDKEDVIGYPSFEPEEIDFWLTQSVIRFVKTRYSGSDTYKGFQQTEKRDADLRNAIKTTVELIILKDDTIFVVRPKEYWFGVGETIYIASDDRRWPTKTVAGVTTPIEKEADPLECTFENFTSRSNSFLGGHILNGNEARPLRLSFNDKIMFRTDGNYYITKFVSTFIKRPVPFDFTLPNVEYTYIPEHAHDEIVAGAVALALENISDQRYATSGRNEPRIIE